LAYPDQNPRFVSGRFVQYAIDGRLAGTALLEMYEGDNRFAVDHGASGAPVFDCEGRIAAVISTVITQVFQTPFGVLRTSTAWGSPNVVSVPVHKLMEFSEAQWGGTGPKRAVCKAGAHCWAPLSLWPLFARATARLHVLN